MDSIEGGMIFMIKKKYLITGIVLAGLVLLLIVGNLIDKKFSVNANTYFVTEVTCTDKQVDIQGGSTDNQKRFTGFFIFKIVGNTLYIKPFYSTTASSNRNNYFALGIGTSGKEITKIYLVGRIGGHVKQIWSKE